VRVKPAVDIRSSDITPRDLYLRRRDFLASAGKAAVAVFAGVSGFSRDAESAVPGDKLAVAKRVVTTSDVLTPQQAVTSYCNYYEFGSVKSDPAQNAGAFKPKPWSVTVDGLCGKPGTYTLEDVLKPHAIEERVYRMRCVEGWSMVIPWDGFSLGDFLARFQPKSTARFVEFTTVLRPQEMAGQRQRFPELLPWPYREGLRMDEAMHPLTMLATGLYGESLLNQNGAPLRLVVPWKYGFKSIKSVVRVRFVEKQPLNTWQEANADYYGFYANVNPDVPTPTYSQATERRIGEFLMRKTLMFNGYGDQVASLYAGMNLRRNF
jgi:methionine sulfoxide reductase catalytic subunit